MNAPAPIGVERVAERGASRVTAQPLRLKGEITVAVSGASQDPADDAANWREACRATRLLAEELPLRRAAGLVSRLQKVSRKRL